MSAGAWMGVGTLFVVTSFLIGYFTWEAEMERREGEDDGGAS